MDAHKTLKQRAQCNTYQPRPPQGTSDVARGEGPTEKLKNAALKKEKQRRVKRQLGNKLPIIYVIKGLFDYRGDNDFILCLIITFRPI